MSILNMALRSILLTVADCGDPAPYPTPASADLETRPSFGGFQNLRPVGRGLRGGML